MDTKTIICVVLILVLIVVQFIGRKVMTNRYTMKLMKAILGEEEAFMKLNDSFMVKMLFHPFNREYMRLNYYVMHESKENVKKQLALFDQMRISKEQHLAVYQMAFQFFLTNEMEDDARKLLEKVKIFVDENQLDPNLKENMEMDIRMYIDKDISTLSFIDEKLQNCTSEQKALWNLKKVYVLKSNDRLDEAMACMKIVIDNTSDPTQKQMLQELLDRRLEDL